jgi:hypothetical protein
LRLLELVSDEINFHKEVKEPWYVVRLLHWLGRRTPKEMVLHELYFLKYYGEMRDD